MILIQDGKFTIRLMHVCTYCNWSGYYSKKEIKEHYIKHLKIRLKKRMREMKDERIKIVEMIAVDMENDVKEFDGKPFTGRTVAEYFGNQGAALAALADVVKSILEQKELLDKKKEVIEKIECQSCKWIGTHADLIAPTSDHEPSCPECLKDDFLEVEEKDS